jgi:HEAT repeat protein
LADPAADQRRLAVRALAGRPEAAEVLGAHLPDETDPSVRAAIFDVLVQTATPAALSQILRHLRSDDTELRNDAVVAAQRLPHLIAPAIEALLCDPDPDLRLFGVRILEDLPHPQVLDWLSTVLWHEADRNVVAAALDVLAECGTAGMQPAVAAARDRFADCGFIGFACDFVAARMGTTQAPAQGPSHNGR